MSGPDDPPAAPRAPVGLWSLIVLQIALAAGLLFLDFGWRDRAGTSGLRVDHQFMGAFLYVALWIGGLVWAVRRKAWSALAVHVLAPVALVLWAVRPIPALVASEHQDLIGKTRQEAMEALDRQRSQWYGFTGDSLGAVLNYKGIDVYLVDERRITRIVPGRDPVPTSSWPPLVASAQQDLVGTPYPVAYQTLLDRGGIDYGMQEDSSGEYHEFNGVRVYFEGEERVRRVAPSALP